ncbi:hypothetical protein COO60DRAFT_1513753 [Scenedesmus sp. NREL 46B-D3]|nr:hypothetical protein COO60DRAFT_1513753 [Scenedesmus sp. NREL 46B-D3]
MDMDALRCGAAWRCMCTPPTDSLRLARASAAALGDSSSAEGHDTMLRLGFMMRATVVSGYAVVGFANSSDSSSHGPASRTLCTIIVCCSPGCCCCWVAGLVLLMLHSPARQPHDPCEP